MTINSSGEVAKLATFMKVFLITGKINMAAKDIKPENNRILERIKTNYDDLIPERGQTKEEKIQNYKIAELLGLTVDKFSKRLNNKNFIRDSLLYLADAMAKYPDIYYQKLSRIIISIHMHETIGKQMGLSVEEIQMLALQSTTVKFETIPVGELRLPNSNQSKIMRYLKLEKDYQNKNNPISRVLRGTGIPPDRLREFEKMTLAECDNYFATHLAETREYFGDEIADALITNLEMIKKLKS